jgi:transposase
MGKAYSYDLRKLVIKNSLAGMPSEEIVRVFKIGDNALTRWLRQYRQTGD